MRGEMGKGSVVGAGQARVVYVMAWEGVVWWVAWGGVGWGVVGGGWGGSTNCPPLSMFTNPNPECCKAGMRACVRGCARHVAREKRKVLRERLFCDCWYR